jgi:phosphoribosyl 1,2-cyclic phosphate phosphodiesterase
MKVTFLGTGTSMGVPVAGGFGHNSNDPRDFRYRCSVWVRTEKISILIDIGPEFRLQTLRSGIKHIDMLLITHEHNDHVAGLDDLRPFNYQQNQTIPAYTTQTCIDSIRHRFHYMFEPGKVPGSVDIDLQCMDEPISMADVRITPLPAKHGELDILGFRINDFSYLTDVSDVPEPTQALMKGSKVVVLSGLRWGPPHPTHMTIPESVEVAKRIGAPQTYLVHMSSYVVHQESEDRLPKGINLAYDELTITV